MNFQITQVVKILLIINVAVFLVDQIHILPFHLSSLFALWNISSSKFFPSQFFTYMFAHDTDSVRHLFSNMFGLLIFGPLLEKFLGPKRFLLLYVITGLGGAVIHQLSGFYEYNSIRNEVEAYIATPSADNFYSFIYDNFKGAFNANQEFLDAFQEHPNEPHYINQSIKFAKDILTDYKEGIPMVGASGAVMGIVMAFALFFPNTELFLLFLPFPIKAKFIALLYIAYEVFGIIQDRPDDNVAHFAHLGGMIFAFFLVQFWKRQRDSFY